MNMLKTAFMALALIVVFAQDANALMTSTNYRLFGDSIGSAGGHGSSTNYALHGTGGEEAVAGEGSSANYVLMAGLQSLSEDPTFTFSVSASSASLGTLNTGSISTESYTLTTSTNAPFGFTTYVYDDGDLRSGANTIDDVSDGAVTAGSEEYGIVTTGSQALLGSDTAVTTSALAVASNSEWINGSSTTVTHNAAISSLTTAGTYTHTVTYISVGNF